MGQTWRIFKVTFSMNLVSLWFIICVSLSSEVIANVEFYPDVTAEDYVIEQVARRFLQKSQYRPFSNPSTIPKLGPNPGFTYQFPGRSPVSEKTSPFAVNPSDPRYYEETRSLTDSTDGIPNLFPRQSVPDEDYDGSVFDLNPVSQTLRTPQQTEHKADHDELKASNSLKPQLPEETAPANYQLYKTPVQAEPDDKSDVYFIAIVAGCSAAAIVGVIVIGFGWYKYPRFFRMAEWPEREADHSPLF